MSQYPGWRDATPELIAGRDTIARANKFHARKKTVEGQTFDSAHEARIWQELHAELRAGLLSDLQRQRAFPLFVQGKDGLPVLVGRYTADFVVRRAGEIEVIDAKARATKTEAYQLRKKLFEALYGIRIVER